jgi:FlaA1/EpsC-like NDP-sugar epimerase
VSLILTAATIGRGGEVFVLDMGKPVRIVELARALIRQYGLRPDEDIAIQITGLRPGERLFEKLFNDHETVLKSSHARILMALDVHANGNGSGEASGNGGWRAEEFHRLMQMVEGAAAPEHAPELHRVVETVEAQCV